MAQPNRLWPIPAVAIRIALVACWACGLLMGGSAKAAEPAASFTIRADWLNRGNVRPDAPPKGYADKYPCILNAGPVPNVAEYDIDFPVSADFTFVALYTAMQSRPVDIYLDDTKVHRGFAGVTGSWKSSHAKWETQCTMRISQGHHTIKLQCPGPCMPHICAFRLESPVPFPEGWRLCREIPRAPPASALPEDMSDYVCDYPRNPPAVYDYHQPFKWVPPPEPRAHRLLEYGLPGVSALEVKAEVLPAGEASGGGTTDNNELLRKRDDVTRELTSWVARLSVTFDEKRTETEVLSLSPKHAGRMLRHARRLIEDFRKMPGTSPQYLEAQRVRGLELETTLAGLSEEADTETKWRRFYDLHVQAYRLKNEVALRNPLLDFDGLLLAKRLTYSTSHIYTTYFDGSRRYQDASGLFVLSPVRPDGELTCLTGGLKTNAIYRDPDLSFDAQRVLFSYKPDLPTPCRVYEVGLDGNGLRQITDSEYDDVDPCYLPGGKRIMFVSTRCRRVTLCHNAYTVSVLHTMNPDGSDVRCISPNTVHDFKPSVMPNGQVAFTRWEYVDKHLGNVQSLWTCNPDGTRMTHVAGNHFGPVTYWEPFRVPNSRLFACILAPHMPLACGPVALIDPADTYASPAIYDSITPELPPAIHFGWLRRDVGYYTYAYPLSEKYFLVSYCYGPDDRDPAGYGIYLLDRWNNRSLIYRDPALSTFEPLPVRSRPEPLVVAERERAEDTQTGTFYVLDAYQGLTGVERGAVKYLRVVEEIPKPVSANCPGFAIQYPVISNRGHLAVKRLWGTVPVEKDGSAHFRAPADKALYFAALDKDFMEVQRMRSFTHIAPGQRFGCVGCHEPKHSAPTSRTPLASQRPASEITPPPHGGVHAPDFAYDAQPVIEAHCGGCHSGPKRAGGIDLSTERTDLFSVAYETLTSKKLVTFVSAYGCDTLPSRPPKYYGSHASKIVQLLRSTHKERVNMPKGEFRRLVTWIDCNCPYYGTYTFHAPGTIGGREIFAKHKAKLADIYSRRCLECHGPKPEPIIHRVRLPDVDKSRVLLAPLAKEAGGEQTCGKAVFGTKDDPDYQALRHILASVRQETTTNPRADMLASRPPVLDPNCRYVYRP